MIENARTHLSNYNLANVDLIVYQGYDEQLSHASIASSLRSGIIEELYKQNEQSLRSKDEQIKLLETELTRINKLSTAPTELYPEMKALFPNITDFTINNNLLVQQDGNKADTVYLAYVKFSRRPVKSDLQKLESWLKARFKSDKVKLVTE
jgi:hypothetical protein